MYYDIQSTFQSTFFTAAKYKIYCPDTPLYLHQVGSDPLEQLYSNVRTQTHYKNCDTLQLENRLVRASILDKIYTKHPDWRQRFQRLSAPVDHSNPSDWTEDLTCGEVFLLTPWTWGQQHAISILPEECKHLSSVDVAFTMLKPKGTYIGVSGREDVYLDTA